jgi:hypothetical protein
MILTYLILKRTHIGAINLMMLNSVPAFVCVASLVLGFNTFSEVMAGNIVGVSFGFLYQYLLFKLVKPRVHIFLQWKLFKVFNYRDTFFAVPDDKREHENDCPGNGRGLTLEQDENYVRQTCIYCQLGLAHELHA